MLAGPGKFVVLIGLVAAASLFRASDGTVDTNLVENSATFPVDDSLASAPLLPPLPELETRTGEITLDLSGFRMLAKSISPLPAAKEVDTEGDRKVYSAFDNVEARYRERYADLAVNPHVREIFRVRSRAVSALRSFLDKRDFLEVETPVLQPIYGGAAARPFSTHHNQLHQDLFLRISFELYLKRLLVGGFERVYEIGRDFRNEGVSLTHNPEFTQLEFYWAYADYKDCMVLVEEIIQKAAKRIGALKIKWGEFEIDLSKKFKEETFYGLLKEATGSDISNMNERELFDVCKKHNVETQKNTNIGQMLDSLMSSLVEPKLINPTFIVDYPKSISPLAKIKRDGSKGIVERFELFIGAAELANSFTELNDPIDQRKRLEDNTF